MRFYSILVCCLLGWGLLVQGAVIDESGKLVVGSSRDATTVVGILVHTTQQLVQQYLNRLLDVIKEPFLWVQQIAGVIATDFDSLGDHATALVAVFMENIKENAVVHIRYIQEMVLIFYRMLIDLAALSPTLDEIVEHPIARFLMDIM